MDSVILSAFIFHIKKRTCIVFGENQSSSEVTRGKLRKPSKMLAIWYLKKNNIEGPHILKNVDAIYWVQGPQFVCGGQWSYKVTKVKPWVGEVDAGTRNITTQAF